MNNHTKLRMLAVKKMGNEFTTMDSFEKYKKRILEKASDEDVLNEIGYCYKRACSDMFDKYSYWVKCYYFLKGLAHYRKIDPMC